MRERITRRTVEAMTPGQLLADTETQGFVARKLPSGVVTFGFRYRAPDGRRPWLSLGVHGDDCTVDQARRLAKIWAGEVAANKDPSAKRDESATSVNSVLDEFEKRYLPSLRSAHTIKRSFARLVRPRIGSKSIYEVRRRDVVELLDAIEDSSGPVMADRTLAFLRKSFNWWQTRDDEFISPIVKGMARSNPTERRRTRILDDEEIRDVWTALDQIATPACFASFIRLLLLTGQRRTNASHAHADELQGSIWVIPAAKAKTKVEYRVPLSAEAQSLLATRRSGYLVSTDGGKTPFSGYGLPKIALDQKIAELRKAENRKPMPHWVLHDLRRTARSIMSRYASPDIAERVIGHAISGMRGVYDHHDYAAEKRAALEALAAHITRIVQPGRVVAFPKRGAR